jgi:triacylglycerol lipase
MTGLAFAFLVAAFAFASLAGGFYWLRRRRLGGAASRALPPSPRALPGRPPAALPRPEAPALAPGPPAEAPALDTLGAPAEAPALAPGSPVAATTRASASPAEASDLATAATAAAPPPPDPSVGEASAIEAARAASAAAVAVADAPDASVVSVEPRSTAEPTVVAAKPEGAERAPAVVLVHGIMGFDQLRLLRWRFHYFRGVADHLRRVGVNAYVVRMPALDAIPARAAALAEFVKALPHERVTLIAHSMGGLDARYAIAHLGLAPRITALVTVATPHRGTPLADLLARRPVRTARRLAAKLGLRSEAVECLTTERMARFNDEVPDAPGVTYACVPCGRRARPGAIHAFLRPMHAYLRRVAGPNDGLVPVSSQIWGAVIEEIEADHWAQVGWSSRFDAPLFYTDVVIHLSQLGLLPQPSLDGLPPPLAPLHIPPRLGPAPPAGVRA